jgi:hypothetical protein
MSLWIWLRAEWDRVAGFGLVLLGALFLFLGYQGMKDSPFVAEQLTYIATGGLGGLCCVALGAAMLISADLHDEWRKLDRIEAAMRDQPVRPPREALDALSAGGERRPVIERSTNDSTPGLSRRANANAAIALDRKSDHRERRNLSLALPLDWRGDGLRRTFLLSILALLVPLSLMTAGWRQAAQTADFDTAAKGLGLSMVGVALTAAVGGIHTSWLRWKVTRRQAQLFRIHLLEALLADQAQRADSERPASNDEVFITPGRQRFHRAGCAALRGRVASKASRSELDSSFSPCGLCDET